MTCRGFRLGLLFLAAACSPAALAQSDDWYVSGSIVYNDDDPDRAIADSLSGVQLNAGWHLNDHVTIDGLLSYSDITGYVYINFFPAQEHIDFTANALFFYDRTRSFAPYLQVGAGYLVSNYETGGSDNGPTASIGAGFWQRFGDRPLSLRFDLRLRHTFEGDIALGGRGGLNDIIASVGLQYSFGRAETPRVQQPDRPKDTDGDGVLDMWDECPDTPAGVDVTSKGCEIKNIDRDDDGDRVPDYRDMCPDTPVGSAVDNRGCALDSDGDGVPTDQDRCPATPPGTLVNAFGCHADDDGDGVLDDDDRCPNTRRNAPVDIYGCEISDVIRLPGVNFSTGSDQLLGGAELLLRDVAETLMRNPDLNIEVAGHTDNVGNPNQNLGLSDRRAKTVLDYLVSFGVDPARLSFRGYGDMAPIADNATAEGRAENRRVELRVVRSE